MKKKNKAFIVILSCVLLASIAVTGFGWFYNSLTEKMSVTSYVRKSYFESGNGTAEDPFEIKYPVQLYYFTWLQNMGYFNQNLDDQRRVRPTHFYVSSDLDMSGFVLPPVGSQQFPFLSEFSGKDKNGKKHVISNLTVCNQSEGSALTDIPSTNKAADNKTLISEKLDPQIVGFFGVVGEYKGILSANNEVVSVKDFDLDHVTVRSNQPKENKTLVGIAVGYINGTVENVGVADSTLQVGQNIQPLDVDKTSNVSDYTLAGYCTAAYKEQVDLVETTVSEPKVEVLQGSGSASGDQWGGSIPMKEIYDDLLQVLQHTNTPTVVSHYGNRKYFDPRDGSPKVYLSGGMKLADEDYPFWYAPDFGITPVGESSFIFSKASKSADRTDVHPYIYLYGLNEEIYKETATINRINGTRAGKTITQDNHYLSVNQGESLENAGSRHTLANSITSKSDAVSATKWLLIYKKPTSNYAVSTFDDYGTEYFLTVKINRSTGEAELSVQDNLSTRWEWVTNDAEQKQLCCIVKNTTYVLFYDETSGNWIAKKGAASGTSTEKKFKLHATVGGKKCFMDVVGGTLSVSSNPTVEWHKKNLKGGTRYFIENETGDRLFLDADLNLVSGAANAALWKNDNGGLKTGTGANERFLCCNGKKWFVQSTRPENITVINETVINGGDSAQTADPGKVVNKIVTTVVPDSLPNVNKTQEITPGSVTRHTYFPLSSTYTAEGNTLTAKPSNTGYIVSGSSSEDKNDQYSMGNIRVSQYPYSQLYNSTLDGTLHVLSKSYHDGGANYYVVSTDAAGTNPGQVTVGEAQYSVKTPEDMNLEKFESSIQEFAGVLDPASPIYGLHFMDAHISASNLVTVPEAHVANETIQNCQMPMNSIDFMLKERGFINFFAGTYFSGNKNFFSLHKIDRDPMTKEITNIHQISKVYGVPNSQTDEFIYEYNDGTFSKGTAAPDDGIYQMMFDTAWIETPAEIQLNAAYYFEVPVNEGEYALGSVSGLDGAYLMYLDISANSQETQRTDVTEITTVESQKTSYIKGIQLVEQAALTGTEPLDPADSVCVSLPSPGINTKISRAGNEVKMTGTGQMATYIGGGITLKNDAGVMADNPVSSEKKITMVFTQTVGNLTTGETTVTVTTTEEIYKDGNFVSRTAKKTVNGGPEETVENPAAIVLPANNALAYHYAAAGAPTITQSITRNEIVVDQYPSMGEPAVNRPDLITQYDLTFTTDKSIVVVVDLVDEKYQFFINTDLASAGDKITILPS